MLEKNNITHEYYKPTEQSTDAYLATSIDLAVKDGAKVVVTPGYLFEEPIYIAQDKYPDVHFILIDGNPHDKDYKEYRTNKNTVGIVFAEEQSDYVTGYTSCGKKWIYKTWIYRWYGSTSSYSFWI